MRIICTAIAIALVGCSQPESTPSVVVQVQPAKSSRVDLSRAVDVAPFASDFIRVVESQVPSEAFTLFVPTNAALASRYGSQGDPLEIQSRLTSVARELLDSHLVDTAISFRQLVEGDSNDLVTRSGAKLRVLISKSDGSTYLILPDGGRAKIQAVDIRGGSGIIHIIDRVIQAPQGS